MTCYTVVDPESGEYLTWSPETETFFFSRSRAVLKEDMPTILHYLQCATEGYPEVVGDRRLTVMAVSLTPTQEGTR